MNASVEWLLEFAGATATPAALRDLITSRVATVDGLEPQRSDLADIVVAMVLEAQKHPDSDHLSVTRVDDGSGDVLDVVCGAPNVRAGAKYPFARTGVTLPGGLRIERRKIRGAVSNGMLCSARELNLGDDHEGILELQTSASPGTPFLEAYPSGDYTLDIDIAPNRPDLLSHLGLAREVAAALGGRAKFVAPPGAEAVPIPAIEEHAAGTRTGTTGGITVRVDDGEGVRAFNGAVIRGVKVGPSPDWLVKRLASVGARSSNNVVDATN
jgi:phenylalanyl-tRNA synthetase beta chain